MKIILADIIGPHLTRADRACQLYAQITHAWTVDAVTLDFAGVVQVSPSFANALFLNLLHNRLADDVWHRLLIENAADHIKAQIDTAVSRASKGAVQLTAYA